MHLYSALSSNELKALYTLLPPAHLYTPMPSQLLNRAYNPGTRYKVPRVINVHSFLCVLPGSHLRLSEPEHISGTNLAQGL